MIADALCKASYIKEVLPVETNIIIAEIKPSLQPAQVAAKLKEHNILVIPISATQIRMVLHLGITPEMVDKTIDIIKKV
jgi:threonine aldolase